MSTSLADPPNRPTSWDSPDVRVRAWLEGRTEEFDSLEEKFASLASWWTRDQAGSSFTNTEHPAFHQILGMGPAAVPLLLADLLRNGRHWFWALTAITGADPVPEADRGDVGRMSQHWLEWGRRNGHLG